MVQQRKVLPNIQMPVDVESRLLEDVRSLFLSTTHVSIQHLCHLHVYGQQPLTIAPLVLTHRHQKSASISKKHNLEDSLWEYIWHPKMICHQLRHHWALQASTSSLVARDQHSPCSSNQNMSLHMNLHVTDRAHMALQEVRCDSLALNQLTR